MSLCSEILLKSIGSDREELKPLECNRWSCDWCAPLRRRRLIAIAAQGEPNKMLTLTTAPDAASSPVERYKLLHSAWKRLVKRILRELKREPQERWRLKQSTRKLANARRVLSASKATPSQVKPQIAYMAFNEKTKRGEPHLHILLRAPFVPQDWIAEAMREMTGSPICWIEAIANTRAAIKYVTKYVSKEPAQFGTGKRYWISRNWLSDGDAYERDCPLRTREVQLVRERWSDVLNERANAHFTWQQLPDGWYRFFKPGYHPGLSGLITDAAYGSI